MMRKKIISLACSVMLSATICMGFAGCEDSGKIKVSIGMWPDVTLEQDVAMYKQWKEDFERDYPEYEIVANTYEYSPSTILAKATTGQLPTVFQTWFTEPQKLIENGFISDITDELKELGWYDKMNPDMREAVSANGRVYGVPRDGYGMGLFLNLNMLYDVGVIDKNADGTYQLYDEDGEPLYPTTFDEVRAVSELIVENYTNTYGLVILSADRNGGWQFSNLAWNFGCEALQIENEDGSWTANLTDPGAVKALEWIQQMRLDDLICPGSSFTYLDWYKEIGSKNAAMAFCGSDAIAMPVTNYDFNRDDIAFVPMPTGDGVSRYSLYGGTPYVFANNATKEQIKGALLFLKYIGRSPETDDISVSALEVGYETAEAKGMPILPTIRPWINEDYLEIANALEAQYVNVNMEYYKDFFNSIETMKKAEEPNYCQDMYSLLDYALQDVLSDASSANCTSLLTTANSQFQKNYLSKLGK